eukprot:RCo029782
MAALQHIEHALGRPLSEEEEYLLGFISARGVAKINFDVCRGISLEVTLADLAEVFRLAQKGSDAPIGSGDLHRRDSGVVSLWPIKCFTPSALSWHLTLSILYSCSPL